MAKVKLKVGYQIVTIGAVRPHLRNPRRGDAPAIAESITANGWYGALTVQLSSAFILAGNHAYREAVRQGATEIPIHCIDVDDQRALAILLADNKASDAATYDNAELTRVLKEIKADVGQFVGTCWTETEFAKLIKESKATAADAEEEEAGDPENPGSDEPGGETVWRLVVRCKSERDQLKVLKEFRAAKIEARAFSA